MPRPTADEDVLRAVEVLGHSQTARAAAAELGMSYDALKSLFLRRNMPSPAHYLAPKQAPRQWPQPQRQPQASRQWPQPRDPGMFSRVVEAQEPRMPPPRPSWRGPAPSTVVGEQTDVDRLVNACRKEGRTLDNICDELGWPPRRAREAQAEAESRGFAIAISGDEIAWKQGEALQGHGTIELPRPTTGERTHILVLSDIHAGNKFCQAHELAEVVGLGYERGCRTAFLPGDQVAGIDRSGKKWHWDLSHHGLEAQMDHLFSILPQHPGLTYHAIDGNHCDTFRHQTGLETGKAIVAHFAMRGRRDYSHYGVGGGFVEMTSQGVERPTIVHMVHPGGGIPYAMSYRAQQHTTGYSPGSKPDILFLGHLHQFCYVVDRGIHAMLCPTFESGDSGYSKSKARPVVVGGLFIEYELTDQGTIRGFSLEPRTYYRREQPRTIDVASGNRGETVWENPMGALLTEMRAILGGK